MNVMFDTVEHMFRISLYRKPLNQFQRVPATSAHPNYMKKGVIIGEAAWLATISSELDIYETALHQLREEYCRLSYNWEWIDHALNTTVRGKLWDKRDCKKSKEFNDSVVFKTWLDPIWDHVSFEKVMETARTFINEHNLVRKDKRYERFLELKMVASKSRPSNFGDLLNTSNKTIVRTLSQ